MAEPQFQPRVQLSLGSMERWGDKALSVVEMGRKERRNSCGGKHMLGDMML